MTYTTQTYNIRIQVCEKCHQHYNHSSLIQSKSHHLARKTPNSPASKAMNFFKEEEEYWRYYDALVQGINQAQAQFLEDCQLDDKFNHQLAYSPNKPQHESKLPKNKFHLPVFTILKNAPYKYLSKLPNTKLSTKRYLNTSTNKMVEFPQKDSFEVYFENLLVFSKLNFQKWPNVRLVSKIIKSLADYCRKEGPLMHNLKPFINDYLDIKSLSPKFLANPPLYEYLMLASNFEHAQIDTEEDQEKIISYLKSIIQGKIKVLAFQNANNSTKTEYTFRNRDILPYSLIDHKVKASTMQGIYLSKQNRIQRSSKHNHYQSALKFNLHHTRPKQISSIEKPQTSKTKNRPLSSNISGLKKSPSLTVGLKTNRNQLFSMIKMGFIQQNLSQQEEKCQNFQKFNKELDKELTKLCSINNQKQNKTKIEGTITKRAKLFVNAQFNPIKTQHARQNPNEDSIIWRKFNKPANSSRRNSKQSQIKIIQSDQMDYEDDLNKENDEIGLSHSSYRSSANRPLKIVPSKKIKRASLFLNQRQSRLLGQQLKALYQKERKHQITEKEQRKQSKKKEIKKQRDSQIPYQSSIKSSRSITYKQESSSSSGDSHQIYSKAWDEGINDSSKIKVLQHSIDKKKSSRDSKNSKNGSSRSNRRDQSQYSQVDENADDSGKPTQNPHHNSMQLRRNKLSVSSRRKSSFYYSNAKNNSLLQMLDSSRVNSQKGDEQKNKRKSSRKANNMNLASGIKHFQSSIFSKVQQGIQCNIEQQLIQLELQKSNVQERSKYQYSSLDLNTDRDTIKDAGLGSFKESLRQGNIYSKSSLLQEGGAAIQIHLHPENNLTNTMRSIRASGFNNRISNFSFQNRHSIREQMNRSREKQQDEMVTVFPQNKFCQAFIVHKFVQDAFYDVDVKRMFTTNESGKSQVFQFEVSCAEVYRKWSLQSASQVLKCGGTKVFLFPKVFYQIDNYSTPLAQVVNRLLKFHPISISRLFTNAHGISPFCQYCIWIYHKRINQFKPVFINDEIPFYEPEPQELYFNSQKKPLTPVYGPVTNENSIWFMLLEKALAKVVGSYYALNETSISDIFSMLTGCPIVNIDHITGKKLEKIFDEKVFSNKKAYVYGLKKLAQNNMRIDRVVGIDVNEKSSRLSAAIVEEKEGTTSKINLESMIRTYQEISLVFFNLSYVFNQLSFPMLQKSDDKVSSLITFYIINEEVEERNEIYLCLGGFAKPQLQSKITIYLQTQQQEDNSLQQLEMTDPLSYYNKKYSYQGEIQKSGNYFFETEIKYGKYLCLIEANYHQDIQYSISTYSSKPITIHDVQHNYTEINNCETDPLAKIIAATKLRMKLKKQQHIEIITEDEHAVLDYPLKIFAGRRNSIDDNILPYDFSTYKNKKHKKKFKSSVSVDSVNVMSSKWIVQKEFIEDENTLVEKKQQQIQCLISNIQRQQQKNQFTKLKDQLRTNQKNAVLKMMSKIEDKNCGLMIQENDGVPKSRKKIKQKKINWDLSESQKKL